MSWEIHRLPGTPTTVYKSIMKSVVILMHNFVKSVHSDALDLLIIQTESVIELGDSTWETIKQCPNPKAKVLALFTAVESLEVLPSHEEDGKKFLEILMNFEGIPVLAEAIRSKIIAEFYEQVRLDFEKGNKQFNDSSHSTTVFELKSLAEIKPNILNKAISACPIEPQDISSSVCDRNSSQVTKIQSQVSSSSLSSKSQKGRKKIPRHLGNRILTQSRQRRVTNIAFIFTATTFSTLLFIEIIISILLELHLCYSGDLCFFNTNKEKTPIYTSPDLIIITIDAQYTIFKDTAVPILPFKITADNKRPKVYERAVYSFEEFNEILLTLYPVTPVHLNIKSPVYWRLEQNVTGFRKRVRKINFSGAIGIANIQVLLKYFMKVTSIVLDNKSGRLCDANPAQFWGSILSKKTLLKHIRSMTFINLTFECNQLLHEWTQWMDTPHLQSISLEGGEIGFSNGIWFGLIFKTYQETLTQLRLQDLDIFDIKAFAHVLLNYVPNTRYFRCDLLSEIIDEQFCDILRKLEMLISDSGYLHEEQLLHLGRCKLLSRISFALKLTSTTSFDVGTFQNLFPNLVEVNLTIFHDSCNDFNAPDEKKIVEIKGVETLSDKLVNFSVNSECYIFVIENNPNREESLLPDWSPHRFEYNVVADIADEFGNKTCEIKIYEFSLTWLTSFIAFWLISISLFLWLRYFIV